MADELLNGREATDWELAAIEHGRQCELARDAEVVAGLIAEYPRDAAPRPVTDLVLEFAKPGQRSAS
jgi:hypothetical protein